MLVRFVPVLALLVAACSGAPTYQVGGTSADTILDARPDVLERVVSVPSIQDRMDADLNYATRLNSIRGLPKDLGKWDKPDLYSNGCHTPWSGADVRVCYDGSAGGPLVVSAGDSHAAHLQPALSRWAKERGWRYASITKAGCPAVRVRPILAEESKLHLGLPYPSCSKWQESLVSTLKDIRPDVVILPLLSRRGLYGSKGMDAWIAGVSQTVSEVSKFSRVVVLGDDPKVGFDVPGCLTTKHDPSKCSKDRKSAVLEDRLAAERMATELAGGRWFDISNWFCTKDSCPAVVAGLVVRRDDNHLTAAFSEYLWPRIDQIPMLLDID